MRLRNCTQRTLQWSLLFARSRTAIDEPKSQNKERRTGWKFSSGTRIPKPRELYIFLGSEYPCSKQGGGMNLR
jgi:hypothetical protein